MTPRLQAVADFVRGETLLDIGSDHALLPAYLLKTGRVRRVIAVEKTSQPFRRSAVALRGLNAEVRLGDGLAPVAAGEADTLSISGMGAAGILKIMSAHVNRLPDSLVLQANDDPEPLRHWAYQAGYWLRSERMVAGFWRYVILALEKREGPDPAYQDFDLNLALRYGPHLLAERHPLLREELLHRQTVLKALPAGAPVSEPLAMIERALKYYG